MINNIVNGLTKIEALMQDNIINTLFNLFDVSNQLDFLYKEEFGDILTDYTYTEMHTIDSIGKIENPNVTKIALNLNLSKAAISKIIKKLIKKKSIEIYKSPDNKKETYYKLTPVGHEVFEKHLKMHESWCEKDKTFFKKFSKKDLEITFEILSKYTKLLETRLESIKENLK